jgi:hypothetical protein
VAVRVDHAHLGGLQLSAAERRLWDAFPERALADLGDGAKGRDGAEKWGQERTVRGEVIGPRRAPPRLARSTPRSSSPGRPGSR